VSLVVTPVLAAVPGYPNLAGTWNVTCRIAVRELDATRTDTIRTAVLTITDNTTTTKGVITTANIVVPTYGTLAVTGFVGQGYRPYLVLKGSDTELGMVFEGRVRLKASLPYSIGGKFYGFGSHSQGALGDDPVGGAATWSSVETHTGSIAALLTQAAAEGSTYVQFAPQEGIHLSDMDTILATDWGLWFDLENATNGGPQLELRFTHPYNVNPDGAGHVDITLLIPTAGTGEWVNRTYSPTFLGLYYGNDPWGGAAFSLGVPTALSGLEALIDAEAAMIANGPFLCGDWELTRVRVEVWEAGARTCYIDDVMIDGEVYSFEPVVFYGSGSMRK